MLHYIQNLQGTALQQPGQTLLTPSSCANTAIICAGLHCSTSVSYNTMRLFLPNPKKYALLCADLHRAPNVKLCVSDDQHAYGRRCMKKPWVVLAA
jgi:hypothetical protein